MSVVLMSKRELNRIDVLARLESGRLTPGAATARPQPDRRHREGRPGGSTVERRQRAARPDIQDGGADAPAPADHWGECGGALGRPEGTAGRVLARADDEPQAAPAGPGGAGQQDGPRGLGPSRQGRGLSSSGRGGGLAVGTAARLSRGRKVRGRVWRYGRETGSGKPVCNTVPRVRGFDLDPIRESHTGPRHETRRTRGRTHVSTRRRAAPSLTILLAPKGASTHVALIGRAGALPPAPSG